MRGAYQKAIEEELSDQRMVSGWVEDHGFNTDSEFYAVIAVAKKIKAKPKSITSGVAPDSSGKTTNRPTLFSTRKSIRDADAGRYALLKLPKKANQPKQLENIAQLKDRYDQTDLSDKLVALRRSQQLSNAQMGKEAKEKRDLITENETEPSHKARKLPDDILTLNAFVEELAKIDLSKLDEKFKNDFAKKINQLAVKYRDNEPIRSFVVQKHKEAVSMIDDAQRKANQIGSN